MNRVSMSVFVFGVYSLTRRLLLIAKIFLSMMCFVDYRRGQK